MCTLISLHIPKTAGNTFLDFLLPNFDEDVRFDVNAELKYVERLEELRTMPEDQKRRLKLIYGHLPCEVHHWLPQKTRYITFIRHPVDRVLSHYYYVLEQPGHPLHAAVVESKMSVSEYVRSGLSGELQNGMTRLLCGRADQDSLRGHGPCGEKEFFDAESNLRNHFEVVGLLEEFDRTLALLSSVFGWPLKQVPRKNVTRSRRSLDSIDRKTLEVVESYNTYDLRIYGVAKEIFQESCLKYGIGPLATPVRKDRTLLRRILGKFLELK